MINSKSDLFTLYASLWEDANAMCITTRNEEGFDVYSSPIHMNERERRYFVRAVFAFSEATLFYIKNEFIDKADVSPKAAMALEETQVCVKNSGEITTSILKIPFVNNLKMTFKMFRESRSLDHSLDYQSDGYRALLNAVGVRDRIMHPKNLEDIVITDSEIIDSLKSFIWVNDNFGYMIENDVRNKKKKLEKLERKMKTILS